MGPSQRLKKLTGALSCVHKAPKCIQSLWDHPKTIPFVQKHKEDAICAILREKTPFWAFPEAQKGVVIYAICLRKAAHSPNNNANPSGLSEKKVYCVESLRFCRSGGKNPILGPSQRLKKLTGALSCVHKAPKCIQSLWDHPKTIPFVQKHKEDAICAILREKTPFWGIPRGSKRCCYLRNLSAQGCALSQ